MKNEILFFTQTHLYRCPEKFCLGGRASRPPVRARCPRSQDKTFLEHYSIHSPISLFVSISALLLLIFITGCCGKGNDGHDGKDGVVYATFYFSEDDVINIDKPKFSGFSMTIYTGKDGVESKYHFVVKHEDSFSWTTSDNQTHTKNINFPPNPGEPGEEGEEGCYQPINANPTYLDGQDGKLGKDKYMVIQLEGNTATFFENTCPDGQCETKSINSYNF
ncbi:hypothetical protein WDW89_15610 [Deltaproteobacteria bacterium TL4]